MIEPSTTPSPWPTKTPRPTIDAAVHLPVAMTLEEARAEVLSWLDPGRGPRVEWSGYVARVDLAVFEDQIGCLPEFWRVGPSDGGEEPPDVGIIVLASTLGLSMGLEGSHGGGSRMDAADGCNSAADARERIVGLFDARTGRRLGVTMDWMGEDAIARWRASAPRLRHVPRPPQSSTSAPPSPSTPSPAAWQTPAGPRVDRDNVPTAFRATLTAYPLLPGSYWTWRVVMRLDGVAWQTSILTETVEAAWLAAPDRLVVRSVRRQTVLHEGLLDVDEEAAEEDIWRLVRPDGFVELGRDPMFEEEGDGLYKADRLRTGLVMEGWPFPHDRVTMGSAIWQDGDLAVVTPAGRFEGCRRLRVMGGAAWGSTRAFCPGIGYVTTDSGACTMCRGALGTMDLARYQVEPPR